MKTISNPTTSPRKNCVCFDHAESRWESASNSVRMRMSTQSQRAFTLVEVTIALGLVSYALLALMGLFTVGLTSSRDSSVETALSQIALHVSSSYSSTNTSPTVFTYNHEGAYLPNGATSAEQQFSATVTANTNVSIPDTSSNLRLLTVSITNSSNPGITNVIQTAAFVP